MATTSGVGTPRPDRRYTDGSAPARRSTETKASFKTTEFFAYVAILIGIFVAGAVTKAGSNHHDVFRASQVWLYAAVLSVGYMISRGLAKSGSREPYTEER